MLSRLSAARLARLARLPRPAYSSSALSFAFPDNPDPQNHLPGTRQNRYALEFERASRLNQHLHTRLALAAQMKGDGVQPNLAIYNCLLEAAANGVFWLEAWAILDDMLFVGIKPDTMSFNHLLHVRRSPCPRPLLVLI
jgi:pentatricopeptide repeat protein